MAVNCGTNSGFSTHVKRGEVPCAPCREARRRYDRQRRAGQHGVVVPSIVLAEVYLNTTLAAQKSLEEAIGAARCEDVVAAYDRHQHREDAT